MKPIISFLLGSGFSVPAGIPCVSAINERLSKINESEIFIHTDQHAFFLNGQVNENWRQNRVERLFVQDFLEFYNAEFLRDGESFHYETFYDFYSFYLVQGENREIIEDFYQRFLKKHNIDPEFHHRDCYNMVSDFNRTFNQLLASLIHKVEHEDEVSCSSYYPYDEFIAFLVSVMGKYDVKVHTLNHDILFEHICTNHTKLWQNFSDGYEDAGSPFYGILYQNFDVADKIIRKKYIVKVKQFTEEFFKPVCLFKLHGSVKNYLLYTTGHSSKAVRIKGVYAVSQYQMECTNEETGQKWMDHVYNEVSPDFLSGTTNKIRYYTDDPYYKNLFDHFEENLSKSEKLIIVGYGFRDDGINEIIKASYKKGKTIIIIDPKRPIAQFLTDYNPEYIEKSIEYLKREEVLNLI